MQRIGPICPVLSLLLVSSYGLAVVPVGLVIVPLFKGHIACLVVQFCFASVISLHHSRGDTARVMSRCDGLQLVLVSKAANSSGAPWRAGESEIPQTNCYTIA